MNKTNVTMRWDVEGIYLTPDERLEVAQAYEDRYGEPVKLVDGFDSIGWTMDVKDDRPVTELEVELKLIGRAAVEKIVPDVTRLSSWQRGDPVNVESF